jgi:hypothetical protein
MRGHNNQPKIGVRTRRDIREGARPRRNVWGDAVSLFEPMNGATKITDIKFIVDFGDCQMSK